MDPARLHRSGMIYRSRGHFEKAIDQIRAAIAICPAQADYYKDLAGIYKDMGDYEQALTCLRAAITQDSGCVEAYHDIGCLLIQLGREAEAIEALRKSIALKPDYARAYNNLALALEAQGFIAQAAACLQKSLQISPGLSEAWNNLGNLSKKKNHLARAERYYRRALACSPQMPAALNNLGLLYQQTGAFDQAISCFQKAARSAPAMIDSFINLGNTLQCMGRFRQARISYADALKIRPGHPVALFNLGVASDRIGESEAAEAFFRRALEGKPNYGQACAYLVHSLLRHCAWTEADRFNIQLDRFTSESLRLGKKPAETPFTNLVRHAEPALNLKVAQSWSLDIRNSVNPLMSTLQAARIKHHKLRIGYLSCNFGNHPTADLMSGIIAQHDRRKFEIICYHYGANDGSRQRQRIEQTCDKLVDLNALSDQAAAQLIHADRPAVLVDLVGHTRGSRLAICALRPAPVQVRYLGFAGSSGADFFDYLIGDPIATPIDQADCFSEKLILMPHSYHVNNYAADYPESLSPPRCDRTEGKTFVFCCFNTSYKIDQRTFDCWIRILEQSPTTVLWLMSQNDRTSVNLKQYAQRSGICPERLQIFNKVEKTAHFARLRRADLCLDTLQVSGAASVADALWADLPVLTVRGKHFASRMSDSILTAAGLSDLIAENDETYVRRAVEFAADPNRLRELKERVRRATESAPIFDPVLFARHLEAAYDHIWKLHQDGQAPRSIMVSDLI